MNQAERHGLSTQAAAGRRLAELSVHPRLAAMLLASQQAGAPELGCLAAALISERDIFRGPPPSSDLGLRIHALSQPAGQPSALCLLHVPVPSSAPEPLRASDMAHVPQRCINICLIDIRASIQHCTLRQTSAVCICMAELDWFNCWSDL